MIIESELLVLISGLISPVLLLTAQIVDFAVIKELLVEKQLHLLHRVSVVRFKAARWVAHRD